MQHIGKNIEMMDINTSQKKAVLDMLYQGIQAELHDETFRYDLNENQAKSALV